jgi:hypothetical protein
MRVLFLDDWDIRWARFHSRLKAPDVILHRAANADEAIKLLDEVDDDGYQYVFLDHDLDPGAYVGKPQEKTGMHVVEYIVRHAHAFKGTKFIIHSLNVSGARERMKLALEDAGLNAEIVPGAWDKVKLSGA